MWSPGRSLSIIASSEETGTSSFPALQGAVWSSVSTSMTLNHQLHQLPFVLGSKRCIHLWENSHRGASNYRAGPPRRRTQPSLALAPAGGLIPTPAPAPSQALAAPYEGFPRLTQIPCEGSRGSQGMAVGVPLPCSCPGGEVGSGGGPLPRNSCLHSGMGQTGEPLSSPFWKAGGPPDPPIPLSFS